MEKSAYMLNSLPGDKGKPGIEGEKSTRYQIL